MKPLTKKNLKTMVDHYLLDIKLSALKTWCSVCGASLDEEPNPECENCRLMVKLREGNDAAVQPDPNL